jgi:uncharacterized protein
MPPIDLIQSTLTSPMVLAFALGVIATVAGSDLRLPEAVVSGLSVYLLFSIGLKGGVALSEARLGDVIFPVLGILALGLITPVVAFVVARRVLSVSRIDASALAAHYGSVSAVTFAVALTVFEQSNVAVEGFAPALLALLEIPGIIVALMLATGVVGEGPSGWASALKEAVLGKSIVLLVGGLAIGWIAGVDGTAPVNPVFRELFLGALTLFLLDLGVSAARRAKGLLAAGPGLLVLGTCVPLVNGTLGVLIGGATGLSVGGSALVGIMAASASYIAAPAAVRVALPDANPAYYLTASLGITFPFNLILGIPLFFELSRAVVG